MFCNDGNKCKLIPDRICFCVSKNDKSLCSQYISAHCPLLDKPPYVCTRCPNEKTCKRNHAYYTAHRAHAEYVKELSSSRKGIRTSPERLLELNDLLMPLVNKGQSINHIFATHSDEIRIREKKDDICEISCNT